jgi:glycosyltransferase involved in cell wall biosynthesis
MRALMVDVQGSGVGYYRFRVPFNVLSRMMDVDYYCLPDVKSKNVEQWLFGKIGEGYDLLHIGYVTHLPYIEACVAARERHGVPFIADIDDDILNVPTYNLAFRAYHGGAQERRMARMFLRISDAVTVSTEPLKSVLSSECSKIAVLPNTLQPDDWKDVVELPKDSTIRLMFAGNAGRYGDLLEVGEAFESIMKKRSDVRLFFLNCAPDWAGQWMRDNRDQHNNKAFAIRRCLPKTYRAAFRYISPDVVFAPVQPNKFNESKSHIKAYDAAMCDSAFLCSDSRTYAEVPTSAAIKVAGTYEWSEALEHLTADQAMCKRLAGRLKEWALEAWHIDKHIHKWVQLYEKVIEKGPITSIDQIVRPGVGGGDGLDKRTQDANAGEDAREASAHIRD